jgi:maltose alpha-D-glucosyltransferase/alpha-amylase
MRIEWIRFDRERYNPHAFAAVRQGAREGTLLDVATDEIFIALMLRNLRNSLTVEEGETQLEFRPTALLLEKPEKPLEHIRAVETEQSNSTALVGSDYVVKVYRKLVSGINPEIEVGRFLTEIAGFAHTPALLGSVEYVEGDRRSAIAVVHAFVANQGDAWTVTSAYLDRFVEEQRLLTAADRPGESEEQIPYLRYMVQTGRRIAEMQMALASRDDIADFKPEPTTGDDIRQWIDEIVALAESAFEGMTQRRAAARESDRALIDQLLALRPQLRDRLRAMLPEDAAALKIRLHGDFHLGQMLIVKDDIFIIDFEGEPRRPLSERRRKAPAARDVAGLVRSIDYSVTAALERALKIAPDETGKLAAALDSWRERATAAFLGAYRETLTDARLWPAEADTAAAMLNFFLLEKAFYEIEYELAYRPDWLRVPAAGTLRILSQHLEEVA